MTLFRRPAFQFAIAFAILFLCHSVVGCRNEGPSSSHFAARSGAPSLRVGTSGDYLPFSDWPEAERAGGAEPVGFSADIARAYALSRGQSIEWVRFQWPELADDLVQGRFDLALSGVTVRSDRSITGRFSLPLTTSGAIVLVEDTSHFRSTTDLARPEIRIAVNSGGHLERVARRLFPEAFIDPVEDNAHVLDRLGSGGVVAIVTDNLEAPLWQQRRSGLRPIGPLTSDRKAAWFPVGGELEVRRFDQWLLAAETDGTLQRLRLAHGLAETQTARPIAALLASLDERLSLMTAVARSKWVLGGPVEDLERERRVLDAAAQAFELESARVGIPGRDATAIRELYRAQIEAAKWIQREWLAKEGPRQIPPQQSEVMEAQRMLDDAVRPALLFLGDRIATLLVVAAANEPADSLAALRLEEVEQALARHHLPDEILRALHGALFEVLDPDEF